MMSLLGHSRPATVWKLGLICLSFFLLQGCQPKPIDTVVQAGASAGTWLGVGGLKGTEMSLPNYYSTQELPKKYKMKKIYYIQEL